MIFEFNLLLTKSYHYNGCFSDVIKNVCESIKKIGIDTFLSPNMPFDIFHSHQIEDNVATQLNRANIDNSQLMNNNFITISICPNKYRKFLIEQGNLVIEDLKRKINSLDSERKRVHQSAKINSYLRKEFDSIDKYIPIIQDKNTFKKQDDKNDAILKVMSRFTDYVNSQDANTYETDLKPYVDTIKYLRRVITFLKLTTSYATLNKINGVVITIGKYGVCNVSFFGSKKFDTSEIFNKHEKWIGKAYRHSNAINAVFDNISNFFECVNLNNLFNVSKPVFEIKNETEIKRLCFGYLSYSPAYFEKTWLKKFSDIKNDFDCIKYYFSLITTNVLLYRNVPFTEQITFVSSNIENNNPSFNLASNQYLKNNNMGPFDNFCCNKNIIVFTHSSNAYSETELFNKYDPDTYDEEWYKWKIANNHRHRYAAKIDATKMMTSIIYASMFDMAHRNLRNKVALLNNHSNHINRLFKAHRFASDYSKTSIVYSSHGPFIKSSCDNICRIIFVENNLDKQESDTKLFTDILWQESNISNGKIFPSIQMICALISIICILVSLEWPKLKFSFSIIALIAISILIIASIIRIRITKK